ncbi:MAG TPA: undecaprenyl-phosphate glucose phosphotransferase [Chloroflexia bacterium]|nr:undecaprenyl-phosphate glucose phosphotransferase [Chloroflexia bacterium]
MSKQQDAIGRQKGAPTRAPFGEAARETDPVTAGAAPSAEPAKKNGRQATEVARTHAVHAPQTAIPELTPTPHAPIKFAPIVLVLAEMLLDAVAIGGAFGLAYWVRFESDIRTKFTEPDRATYITMLIVTLITMLVTFYFSKLYRLKRGASRVDEFYKIAAAASMGTVLALATNSIILGDKFVYSRQILLMGWFLVIVFVTVSHILYSIIVGELRKHGIDRARVLVIGTGPTAYTVAIRLERHRTLGYEVVGLVDESPPGKEAPTSIGKMPVLGNLADLVNIVNHENVEEVIVALQGASDNDFRRLMSMIKDESVSIKIYPDAFQLMTQNGVSVGELSGLPLLSVKDVALRGWNRRIKRLFDILFSAAVLIITSPIMLIIAIAVKLGSPGPVFFIQERVGLDNRPFQLVKFRSMRTDADPVGWTTANDPRRTKVGSFIRRFSLDELPQFFNVLIGEMSVVGPRPEQPEYVREFAGRIKDYIERHREKAGITGWAQVNGFRGDSSIEVRTALDLYYVEHWSVLFDLTIIVRTIVAMFRGKNAY